MKIIRLALILAVLFLPAPFFGGVGGFPVAAIQVISVAAFFLLLFEKGPERLVGELSPIRVFKLPFFLFAGFVVYVLAQWILGPMIFYGAPGSVAPGRTQDYFVQLFCYGLLFIVFVDFLRSFRSVEWLVVLTALEIVFLAALGFYQNFAELTPIKKMYGFIEPTNAGIFFSSFRNANHYGAFLWSACLLLLAFILTALCHTESERKLDLGFYMACIFSAVFLVAGVSIFCATAKAAFIIYALTVFFVPLFFLKGWQRVFWGLVCVAGLIGLYQAGLRSNAAVNFSEWRQIADSLRERYLIYRDMVGIFFDFPLFGVGLGASKYITPLYQVHNVENFSYTHIFSHHLELLADTGLVGYLLFMTSLGLFLWIGQHGARRSELPAYHLYGMCSFFAILIIGILSLIDEYLLTPAVAVFFVFHLAVLARCAAFGFYPKSQQPVSARWLSAATHFRPHIWLLSLTGGFFMLFHAVTNGWAAALLKPQECDEKKLLEASKLSPGNAEYLLLWANACYIKDKPEALWIYQRALEQAPTWSKAWLFKGRAEISSGNFAEGFEDLEHAARLMPHNRDAYLYVILTALRLAEKNEPPGRTFYEERARYWLEESQALPRPLTAKDYSYLSMHAGHGAMPQEDNERLEAFISRYASAS